MEARSHVDSDSRGSTAPLVSVITPTWHRRDLLLGRCMTGVRAQDYPYLRVEHVIVSDGPDEGLAHAMRTLDGIGNFTFLELPGHDPGEHWGHWCRLAGIEASRGEYITYCDDDDVLRPEHCRLMVEALEADPGAGFAVSRMRCHGGAHASVTGWGALAPGNVGTPMIMHRREILQHGTWGPASWTEDWDLVERWLDAGVRYVNVDAETSDVWPSRYRKVRDVQL